jgi:type II secretory pathway pseudopilin PulG
MPIERCVDERGFTLAEVVVAIGLLAAALVSLAELLALAANAARGGLHKTAAVVLAEQKMEQLRGLAWGFDSRGLPLSDLSTDVAAFEASGECAAARGGAATGLSPSPPGTLDSSTDGYVDYVDARGCGLGGGAAPPRGAVFVRRWSIVPEPSRPNDTLLLQVLVVRARDAGARAPAAPAGRRPDEARLVSLRTRKVL